MRSLKARAFALLLLASSPDGERPAPSPSPPSERRIADSVEPAVEAYLKQQRSLCAAATSEGVPCFPVSAEAARPEYSVRESLQQWRPRGSGGSRSPVLTSPYGTPIVGVSFDPCVLKSFVKGLRGQDDTYYLYRVWDQTGEQVVLRDRPLEPTTYLALPQVRYELVSQFDGVCAALAAWRKAEREAQERRVSRPVYR